LALQKNLSEQNSEAGAYFGKKVGLHGLHFLWVKINIFILQSNS